MCFAELEEAERELILASIPICVSRLMYVLQIFTLAAIADRPLQFLMRKQLHSVLYVVRVQQ